MTEIEKAKQEERDRVFKCLEDFGLMEKGELEKFKKAYPFIIFPEEMPPLTQDQLEWAKESLARYEREGL